MTIRTGRRRVGAAALLGAALVTSACGTGGDSGGSSGGTSANADNPECAEFEDYQGHDGTTVSVYTSIRDIEADRYVESYEQFEECTGITVAYEGSGEFEAQLNVKVAGGNAPDIAYIPQPGLLRRFAEQDKLVAPSDEYLALVEENYPESFLGYSTIDGTMYGAPNSANVKSFVWYSPKYFSDNGFEIPQTWDEMLELSDAIAAKGVKPWCAGIESGDATGWVATDWLEDVILRETDPETYDQWVEHEIPFNDSRIVSAAERVAGILKNEKYMNGGYGDVRSITTVSFQDGGLPITTGKCALHRQASFYSNNWPEGTQIAEDGDVFAFYLPPVDPSRGKPVLGGSEFVVAFNDRPEVDALRRYLASEEYVNRRAQVGEFLSANNKLDAASIDNPILQTSLEILQDPEAVFRFDGSDLMPAAVGAGSFWKGMTEWLNGKETKPVLDQIEQSWPS